MKNKFYLLKKPRTFIFVQIMLVFGLFTGSLQAQPTHIWKGGTVEDGVEKWSNLANWSGFTTILTIASPGTVFASGSSTITVPDTSTILVGDYISGVNIPLGTTVVAIPSATTLTISSTSTAANTASAYGVYRILPDALTVPGSVAGHAVIINSGTCTVTTTITNNLKISLGNTSPTNQGKLVINSGTSLSFASQGTTSNPTILIRGGLIDNNGSITSIGQAQNSACIRFDRPEYVPAIDWGIVSTGGAGTLALNNSYAAASALANGGIIIFNHNNTPLNAPKLFIGTGSTSTTAKLTLVDTFPFLNVNATNTNAEISGAGLTVPASLALFKVGAGSVLTINSGVTLSCGAAPVATTVAGRVNNAGTINNASAITNTGTIENTGTLTNTGSLVLASTATTKGYLLSNSNVNNVTQQRYLSSNQRGWRLLSNPLASTTFNSIATASNITLGTNYTGEYVSASNTWTSTDGTATMASQQAYKVFITGLTGEAPAYATGPSNVTLKVTGTAANAVPTAITTTAGEFYLVANPYTAPVSISNIITASTGLSNTVSYYNPTVGSTDTKLKAGGYDNPTVSGAAGSATDVVIPPMGAIFVQATSAGTINVPKTAIFTGTPGQTGTYNHKTSQTKVATTIDLKVEISSDGTYYDTVSLRFKEAGSTGSNIDFGKLPNTTLDAYSIAGANKMAVSELELKEQMIPLGITSTIQKSYSFKVAENTIPASYEAVLVDTYLNKNTVLAPGTDYVFAIDSNPASQGDTRFAINLKTAGALGVEANALDANIQVYPNPSRGQFNITNTLQDGATIEISSLNGQRIHTQKLNSGTTAIQTKSWATGVYILKATSNGTETTKKLIIQ